jgi:hypothetical protein
VTRKGLQSWGNWLVVAFLLAACSRREGDSAADTTAPADTATVGPAAAAHLEAVARNVIAFLQGGAPFDSIALSDTVTLYVAPEGGGGRSVYRKEELRQRSSWKVVALQRTVPVAPSARVSKLTTKAGRHLNCGREYDLATWYPELATRPHVGTTLVPEQMESCLQSWNLTLVFDSAEQARLVAAVYDQYEW